MRRKVVAVVGSAECDPGTPEWERAYHIGKLLAWQGYRVLTGGLGGVMEAALAGAKASENYREGGTVALLPSFCPETANPCADIVIATGADLYMNAMVANADAVVAIGGGAGTLSEIAMALERGRPVFACWDISGSSSLAAQLGKELSSPGRLYTVKSAPEVAAALTKAIGKGGAPGEETDDSRDRLCPPGGG